MPGLIAILVGLCSTIGFILLMASGRYLKHVRLIRAIGSAFLSIPLGCLAYLTVGLIVAHLQHGTAFFSVPFGGYTKDRLALTSSMVVWIFASFGAVYYASRWLPLSDQPH